MPKLRSIQALRALAALAVLLYHACQWADGAFLIGAAGVDLFFVISGFVIWLTLQDRGLTAGDFLRRRLWRVAPPYWIASLATLAAALAWPRLLQEVYPKPWHAILSLLFIPHLNPVKDCFPLLPTGWSLVYEMAFYLLAALCLGEPPRQRFGRLAWSLVGLMGLGMALALSGVLPQAYYLGANPMLMQFVAGMAIARTYVKRRLPGRAAGFALIGASAALYVGLSFFDFYTSLWRPLLWGAPATLLVLGAVSLEAQGLAPRWRALGVLGAASYALYLWHWPVVVLVARLLPHHGWLSGSLGCVLSLAVGLAFWRFVERPLLAFGAQRWPGRRVATSALLQHPATDGSIPQSSS